MEEEKINIEVLKGFPETSAIAAYMQLLKWMRDEQISKEDLALACQIFLLINQKSDIKSAFSGFDLSKESHFLDSLKW